MNTRSLAVLGTVGVFATLLIPVVGAAEAWTDTEESRIALDTSCSSISTGGSCHMAMLQKHTTKPSSLKHKAALKAGMLRTPRGDFNISLIEQLVEGRYDPISMHQDVTNGDNAPLNDDGLKEVMKLKSKFQLTSFVNRVLKDLDLKVVYEENFRGYIISLYEQNAKKEDYNGVRWMLEDQADQPCGWVMRRKPDGKWDGNSAPLTQDGYVAVVELHDKDEVFRFASRVIKEMGYRVKSVGKLHGLLSFFNCERDFQTLDKLKDELENAANMEKSWLGKDGEEDDEEYVEETANEEGVSRELDHSRGAPGVSAIEEQHSEARGDEHDDTAAELARLREENERLKRGSKSEHGNNEEHHEDQENNEEHHEDRNTEGDQEEHHEEEKSNEDKQEHHEEKNKEGDENHNEQKDEHEENHGEEGETNNESKENQEEHREGEQEHEQEKNRDEQ